MHHPNPKGFPSRLVRLRAEARMTQKQLSEASGISVPQIGRYEMGTSAPRMTALVKLASALGCDVTELANAEEQEPIVGIELVSEDASTLPLAIAADSYAMLKTDADRYGVPIEVMLTATIKWFHSNTLGNEISIEDAVEMAKKDFVNWPG